MTAESLERGNGLIYRIGELSHSLTTFESDNFTVSIRSRTGRVEYDTLFVESKELKDTIRELVGKLKNATEVEVKELQKQFDEL